MTMEVTVLSLSFPDSLGPHRGKDGVGDYYRDCENLLIKYHMW